MPAVSQNRVRLMSTTTLPGPRPAASSSAARNPAALVMSISSGVTTTGTPLTISTANLTSDTGVPFSPGVAPEHEQGDIVAGRLAADHGPRHGGTGRFRRLGRHRPAQPAEPFIDHLAGPLDQAVGVKAQQGARRDRHGRHRASRIRGNADQHTYPDVGE